MKIHENPWKSMRIHENPWESMKIHENPWEFIKKQARALRARAPVFESILMDSHGFSWILMDFHGFSLIFMDSHWFSWILIDFHWFPWISIVFCCVLDDFWYAFLYTSDLEPMEFRTHNCFRGPLGVSVAFKSFSTRTGGIGQKYKICLLLFFSFLPRPGPRKYKDFIEKL